MGHRVIEISTEVFRLVQERAPQFAEWADEKTGPLQKIILPADVYEEFVDRAIAQRKTLDEVVREFCKRRRERAGSDRVHANRCRRWMTGD
ncbi:MAG TPA: hypothetical protein VMP11_07765 [Verrucomicrobiae bacterium]|nr:hypothetical protein [Verrucomicrobiae bacterium]